MKSMYGRNFRYLKTCFLIVINKVIEVLLIALIRELLVCIPRLLSMYPDFGKA